MNMIIVLSALLAVAYAAPQTEYKLRLQPELDTVDVDSYLKNDRLFKLQLKCLLDEGPCDIVGRWLKPRVARALLGECPYCTPIQMKKIDKVLEDLQTNRPETYRQLFVKFIEKAGIKVDGDKNAASETTTDAGDLKEALKDVPTDAPSAVVTDTSSS